MLSRREKKIMQMIYDCCTSKKGTCLMSLPDILSSLPEKDKYTEQEVLDTIKSIALDDYIEALPTEKKGVLMYLFTLKTKGFAFKRELITEKRALYYKLIISGVGALITGIIAIIIRIIVK